MNTINRVFFATDFSECAQHARTYAFALAKRFGATLHIGHVMDSAFPSYVGLYGFGAAVDRQIDEIREYSHKSLAKEAALASAQGIEAHGYLLNGRPPEEIAQKALDLHCDLIVIGTHGRSGFDHLFFGSTCERVVRYSSVPVLSVKPKEKEFVHEGDAIEINRVLCPCDLSDLSEQAVALAADFCRAFDATLTLLHVIDSRLDHPALMFQAPLPLSGELHEYATKRLDEMAARYPDLDTRIEVVTGTPHQEIGTSTLKGNVDLVVVATHGRRGIPLALIGSSAEKVVRTVAAPILTIRPTVRVKDEDSEVETNGARPGGATV